MAKIAMTSDKKIMVLNEGVEGIPSITIDSELSDTSTNPVQNKVIKAAIDAVDTKAGNKQDKIRVSGLLKGDGTTISAAVAGTDYMVPPTGGTTGQILKKTETGTEWADSDVFIATYGTTTSAEIEAAYQAGKICAVCIDGRKNIYFLSYRHNANTHIFTSLRANTANYATSTMFIDACKCEDDAWDNVSNFMTKPANHASTHASGGSDPITPASIGAATMTEVNSAIQTAIGNAIGGSY